MKRLSVLVVLMLFGPLGAAAQFLPGSSGPEIDISPRFPEASQLVTASLSAYNFETDGASIRWFVDGIERSDAMNSRSLEFTTGALGIPTTISAQVLLPGGGTINASREVRPTRVDVVVEADTSTPLHYKGRALPSSGASIRAVALPQTNENPRNLFYKWSLNNQVLEGGALLGKNSISFPAPISGEALLTVEVGRATGELITRKTIAVPVVSPEMYFYQDNPLRGLSRTAIPGTFPLVGEEVTVRAEPYYMASDIMGQNPHMEWEVNSRSIDNPSDDPQTITLRRSGGSGSFTVNFHLRNLEELLQGVEESFTVTF